MIPATLDRRDAFRFWAAVILTGGLTGVAAALTRLLELVQRVASGGTGTNLLESAQSTTASHHLAVLLAAGVATGLGQFALKH
jgi:hypothetical protein